MNSNKYLTKNELKYFNKQLEDAKIKAKMNDIIRKEIISKNVIIKPEIKDYLIKDLEEKDKDKNKNDLIEDNFKKNLLSIMSLKDYDKIKNNDYFNVYTKNLININFERIKIYIKTKYVKLNIDEFIPIIKLIINKKDLMATDNLTDQIINEEEKIKDDIIKIEDFYVKQKFDLKEILSEDLKQKYTIFINDALVNLHNEKIEEIDKYLDKTNLVRNLLYAKIEELDDRMNLLNSEKNQEELGKIIEDLKKYYLQIKKIPLKDFTKEYNLEKNNIFRNKDTGASKIQKMFRNFKIKKMELIERIDKINKQKLIDNNSKKETNLDLKRMEEDVAKIIEKGNNNEIMNMFVKVDESLNELDDNLDEISTAAQTDLTMTEKKDIGNVKDVPDSKKTELELMIDKLN